MTEAKNFIDEKKINSIINQTANPSADIIFKICQKAREKRGLTLEETGRLLNTENPSLIKEIFKSAGQIKKEIYGERLVIFAPLYVSSHCVNNCAYCGFHAKNLTPRKKLTPEELREQVIILENMGHKRLLLEFGEDETQAPIDYAVKTIETIYETKSKNGAIRRVNVNLAATTVENYRLLKQAGIGTYQLFQETYHQLTYEKLHRGPKADYERQLFAMDRAFTAGIDDVGLGVLFGLYDYKFEVLSLLSHAQYLEKNFNVGPHTISVPRFQPAETVNLQLEHAVSENELLKIIAILRLAVPYTGMIISTRERPEIRTKAFEIGISQASAASRTSPGGYGQSKDLEQFTTADPRNVSKFIEDVLRQGLLPSFCTACYRSHRTGETFMAIAKPGDIHNFCRPNAILTFQEYLADYANEQEKNLGGKIISKYLTEIPDEKIKQETILLLERIAGGERDLYF